MVSDIVGSKRVYLPWIDTFHIVGSEASFDPRLVLFAIRMAMKKAPTVRMTNCVVMALVGFYLFCHFAI